MANERLRAALLQHGLSTTALAGKLGVDHKTVERWIGGRTPYRRHRFAIANQLGVDEVYLWPDALSRDQVAIASESEIIAVYPHRSEVPRDGWERLFSAAEQDIGVLVYSGLFLAEDHGAQRVLADKAKAGVQVRILLGDPGSPQVSHIPVKQPSDGQELDLGNRTRNALQRSLRCLGERAFALLTQRWRTLQHITARSSEITEIARAALVLTQYEHGYIK